MGLCAYRELTACYASLRKTGSTLLRVVQYAYSAACVAAACVVGF